MWRDIYLEITKSVSRYLAIVAIVALGVGFLYGVKVTPQAMRYTADRYFDAQHYSDFRIVSSVGFSDADAEQLKEQPYVLAVQETYSMDALIETPQGIKPVRLHAVGEESSGMNRPSLTEGAWPAGSGECLVDAKQAGVIGNVGSRIKISDKNKPEVMAGLQTHEYVISGFVESPEYVNYANRGSITIGEGAMYCFLYIPRVDFRLPCYTDLLIAVKDSSDISCYSAEYEERIAECSAWLQKFARSREEILFEEMRALADFKLAAAEKTLLEASQLAASQAALPGTAALAGNQGKSLQDMENELTQLRREAENVPRPRWLVLARRDNKDYVSLEDASLRLNALTSVFPLFFYLIAALVCLTTLTRMVEEQRTQMGVFRALGFSRAAVAGKYLAYAGSATILGVGGGLLAGQYILPPLFYRPFDYSFTIPQLAVPLSIPLALATSLTALAANNLTALWVSYREVGVMPADLMRPKTPAPGHRVLLERMPFIWQHLSFLLKVTARNLFRFKKRFYMTVLGIGGCTALLLTGFGLRDSIAGTVPSQYYGLHSYHLFINLISPSTSAADTGLNRVFPDLLEEWLYCTQIEVKVDRLSEKMTTYLFVPDETEKMGRFIDLRDPKTKQPLVFPEAGKVILSEKIANQLGAGKGDTIRFGTDDGTYAEAVISGVTENYIYNFIFVAPGDYQLLFGKEAQFNVVLGRVTGGETITGPRERELTTTLMKQENVISATTIASIRREFDTAMKDLDAVVLVLLICAGLLNFVVLYNLININITERTREIATIKVLGFQHREVFAYINREIIVLMVIGILAGLAGGFFLHRFTITHAEVGIVHYVRNIGWASFAWSVALTVLFTAIVSFSTQFRLQHIKMVESLKSVE